MKSNYKEQEKKFYKSYQNLCGMSKESVVLSFPKRLKRASGMFEKDGKKWKAKSPQDMDLYIERKRPFDIMHKYWDTKAKKYITRCVGFFGNLSTRDRVIVYRAFCENEQDKQFKKTNKFYLVDTDYAEHLKSDKIMKDWAGKDKLKQQLYKAWRNGNDEKYSYYEKLLDKRIAKINKGKNEKK